jgi:acyl CoA:acetate/3-ketoacid CoA transferase beta subunit
LTNLENNKEKSSVVGSIVTSLGVLKFKELKLMDSILDWIITNKGICRAQDIAAYIITAATLGYKIEGIQNLPIVCETSLF